MALPPSSFSGIFWFQSSLFLQELESGEKWRSRNLISNYFSNKEASAPQPRVRCSNGHCLVFNFSIAVMGFCNQESRKKIAIFSPIYCNILRGNNLLQIQKYSNNLLLRQCIYCSVAVLKYIAILQYIDPQTQITPKWIEKIYCKQLKSQIMCQILTRVGKNVVFFQTKCHVVFKTPVKIFFF